MSGRAPRHPAARPGAGRASLAIPLAFFAVGGAAVLAGRLPWAVPAAYLVMSIVTYIVYATDKSAARGNQRRTPEKTLHLLALACGWPGAMLAQQRLRHKSKKEAFRGVFWLTVAANCGALAWLLSTRLP